MAVFWDLELMSRFLSESSTVSCTTATGDPKPILQSSIENLKNIWVFWTVALTWKSLWSIECHERSIRSNKIAPKETPQLDLHRESKSTWKLRRQSNERVCLHSWIDNISEGYKSRTYYLLTAYFCQMNSQLFDCLYASSESYSKMHNHHFNEGFCSVYILSLILCSRAWLHTVKDAI